MKRSRFAAFVAGIAAAIGLAPSPRATEPAPQQQQQTARTRVQQRESNERAPASNVVTAGRQALGIIDAPDFRAFRHHVPIWVGRPRSRHGRQYSARV
jgi:hypothetical protein